MTRTEKLRGIPVKEVLCKDLQVGDHIRMVYSFVEITEVKVRAKTTKICYKSLYDGYESAYPLQFKNEDFQSVKIK